MRIRSIKPEFWRSEDIARLCWEDRLLFIGLWSYVDDNGVGRDVDKLIVADLLPLEDDPRETVATVSRALARLSEAGLITRYSVGGRPFLHITTWDKHQRIDKPAKGRYPVPEHPDSVLTCGDDTESPAPASSSRDRRETLAPGAGEQGNRGTGEQGKTLSRPSAAEPPPGFAEFWLAYPRKIAKQKAETAYRKALKTTEPSVLLDAARAFARQRQGQDQTYTPHPSSWLNGGQWADEDPRQLVPGRDYPSHLPPPVNETAVRVNW